MARFLESILLLFFWCSAFASARFCEHVYDRCNETQQKFIETYTNASLSKFHDYLVSVGDPRNPSLDNWTRSHDYKLRLESLTQTERFTMLSAYWFILYNPPSLHFECLDADDELPLLCGPTEEQKTKGVMPFLHDGLGNMLLCPNRTTKIDLNPNIFKDAWLAVAMPTMGQTRIVEDVNEESSNHTMEFGTGTRCLCI